MRYLPACSVVAALLLLMSMASSPQVLPAARPQDFVYSEAAVQQQAAVKYLEMIEALGKQGALDDDAQVSARVARVGARIIRQAIMMRVDAKNWRWEIHTSSSADPEAASLAGGKLLFSSAFIRRFELTDGELAALVGHEVAHALADHQREELSEVARLNPATRPLQVATAMARLDSDLSLQLTLATLARTQELEADRFGLILAYRAGWPAKSLVSFYEKLAPEDHGGLLNERYPPAALRLKLARQLTASFAQGSRTDR